DIELFDDFPARYNAYARREHRWVRGDWQLLPWLFRRVPVRQDERAKVEAAEAQNATRAPSSFILHPSSFRRNPLPLLERWKVLDNRRRSLVPPALVLWLALGWFLLPVPAWATAGLAVGALTLPFWLQSLGTVVGLVRGGSGLVLREYLNTVGTT